MKNRYLKKLLWAHVVISVLLCVATIVTNYLGYDVTALAGLAGASLFDQRGLGRFLFLESQK